MFVAIMPLWRSNKGYVMGASYGHKGRHRPESKFYQKSIGRKKNFAKIYGSVNIFVVIEK